MRWTIDERKDLEFIRAVIQKLSKIDFKMNDVLDVLENFPELKEINTKLKKYSLIIIKFLVGAVTLVGLVILTFLNGITFWSAAIAGIVIVLLFLLSKTVSITNNNLIIPVTVFFLLVIFLVLGNFNVMDMKFNKEISLPRETSWDIEIGRASCRERV